MRDDKGRFRKAQTINEEISSLPNFNGKKPGQIRQTLKNRGYTRTTGRGGGEVWTKPLPDGNTAAVRIDPKKVRTNPRGFSDEVPHVHVESVPTVDVVGGNYGGRHDPPTTVTKYDSAGGITTSVPDQHIPMSPGKTPFD